MSFRLDDQPEYAGPVSEDPEPGQPRQPYPVPGPARPAIDPAAEAAERTIEAEKAADQFRSAPANATVIS